MKKALIVLFLLFVIPTYGTVPNGETVRQSFACNGVDTTFTFTFACNSSDDVLVYTHIISTGVEALLVIDTDYNIAPTSLSYLNGGVVTISPALASTFKVVIVREIKKSQETSQGAITPTSIVASLDKLTRITQDLQDRTDRSWRLQESDSTAFNMKIPGLAARAQSYPFFDIEGNLTYISAVALGSSSVTPYMETLLDDPDAVTAQNTLLLKDGSSSLNLLDIITKGPVIDVRAYGVLPSASDTDNFTNILAAIAASSEGQVLYFPVGLYNISETLVITKRITLKGDNFRKGSSTETQLIWTQTDGTNGIEPTVPIGIEGIQLTGNALAGNGIHIDIAAPIGSFVFRDMRSVVWGGHGLFASEFFINEFYNCAFLGNDTDGVHLVSSALNKFYGCQIEQNDGTADIYLDTCNTNFFDAQTGNGTATYGIFIADTNRSYGNKFFIFHDGQTDRGVYLGDNSWNNEIFYQGGTSFDIKDKGWNNRVINTLMPQIPTYQYASNSVPLAKNQVRNPSGVFDDNAGWTDQATITWTRENTTGVSTGTCQKFVYSPADGADAGTAFFTNRSDAIVTGDTIVVQFWMKTDRDLTVAELVQLNMLGGDLEPQEGAWIDVNTDWRFFNFFFKAKNDVPEGIAVRWLADGATGIDVLTAPLSIFVTDVALYINPEGRSAQTPFVFAGGKTEHVNYPLSNTVRLDQTLRLPNLGTEPANPEPGAIAMADGMNWDPLATSTSCSELVFYGQCILVGDDYEWAKIGATNEYSVGLTGGGADPSLTEPDEVRIDGVTVTKGDRGSLNENEWAWGQDAGTSYNTIIVRLTGDGDPDSESDGAVTAMKWTAFGTEALK
jgi:hypothetical protein